MNVYALREFESNQTELTGVVSGPLSDTVRARLAVRSYQEDGYIQNTFKNNDEPQRDEDTIRLTLDWDITADLSASLKVERNDFLTHGRQIEIVKDTPNLRHRHQRPNHQRAGPIGIFRCFSHLQQAVGRPHDCSRRGSARSRSAR